MSKSILTAIVVLALMAGTAWSQSGATVVLDGQVNVNTNWSGNNGSFELNANLGPASFGLFNQGATFQGTANMSNAGNNPYGYGVDSTNTFVSAGFTGGGSVNLGYERTASYSPMYGTAGQQVYGSVESTGTGDMALTINTNYAALGVGNYSQPSVPGGGQFAATGDFLIQHSVTDGSGDGAGLWNAGSGSTRINAMSSDVGGSSFNFGAGQGCYTNATVVATGSGQLSVGGNAGNYLNAPGFGTTLPGGGSFNVWAVYSDGLNVNNFSVKGN